MTVIGNFFLVIASLCVFWAIQDAFTNSIRGGDAAVGHAYVTFAVLIAFVVSMAIVTILIGLKGGFSSFGDVGGMKRLWLVFAGIGFVASGLMVFSAGGLLKPLRYVMMGLGPIVILSLLVGAFLLLNDPLRSKLPMQVWRLPIYIVIGAIMVALGYFVGKKAWHKVAVIVNRPAARERDIQQRIAEIDATDLMRDGVFLYSSTDANHDKPVRERALARIKSRPDWQEELVRRLQNDWAPEAFTFLASNEVDNKAMFAEPVRQGVLIQARLVRENIRQCRDKYDLYGSKYLWEVERVLRTVAKFEGLGTDYRPAIQELRNALDEPRHFEVPKLMAKAPLDKWLKKH